MDRTVRVRTVAGSAGALVLAVVCTLLVTQAWSVGAAPGDADSTFVPTPGCRLADTRPAPDTVGPRSSPLGPDDIYEVAVQGSNGDCVGALAIPSDAVAVALNVTAVNATAPSFISIFPADLTTVPLLSNLNVTAGAPPTPNKVDVKLSPDGEIKVFNNTGRVDVVLDIVGYYTNATLQELSQRVVALETAQATGVDSGTLARIEALEFAQPFAVTERNSNTVVGADTVVVAVTVTAPVAGQVIVNSTAVANEGTSGDFVRCSISDTESLDSDYTQLWESAGPSGGDWSQLAGTRVFDIAAEATVTYNLVCDHDGASGRSSVRNSVLTAIFTPAP